MRSILLLLLALSLNTPVLGNTPDTGYSDALQTLKQQSLALDRDLLMLEEKITQPVSIYLTQNTDTRFVLEKMVLTLGDSINIAHQYTDQQRKALARGAAQLLYSGGLPNGKYQLITYYSSNKGHQGGVEFEFVKSNASRVFELRLQKEQTKESRLRPTLLVSEITSMPSQKTSQEPPVFFKYLQYLKATGEQSGILSQIMFNEKLERLGGFALDASLMKAQLYLEKGLHASAEQILENIIKNTSAGESIKNEARFLLGKSLYFQQQYKPALKSLQRVQEPMSQPVRAELQHLQSLIMMRLGHYPQAASYLRKNWWNPPGNWALYARLNLGIALIKSDDSEAGFELIKQLGAKKFNDDEARSIVDKANQTLGYLLLNQGNSEGARSYLEKVNLQGPYSSLALLGAGWASARLGQYKQAIVPWAELQKYDMRDPAVQESMLTLPYAFEQLGLVKKSAKFYQKAVKQYEAEMNHLLMSIKAIEDGQLNSELERLDHSNEKEWLKSVDQSTRGVALRYIKQLINDAEFFRLIQDYRQARLLESNATKKISTISGVQQKLLTQAGAQDEKRHKKNRDQIRFIEILAADLMKRSNIFEYEAGRQIKTIVKHLQARAQFLLNQRKAELDVYLVQSRLALAQSYDLLKTN